MDSINISGTALFLISFISVIIGIFVGACLTLRKLPEYTEYEEKSLPVHSKHLFSFDCRMKDGSYQTRIYSVKVSGEYPTENECKVVKENVIRANESIQDCCIISISRLRG